MKLNSSQVMIIVALTLAIIAVAVGIVVELFPAPSITTSTGANQNVQSALPSLNPNLKAEANFGTETNDEVVYATSYGDYVYIFSNSDYGLITAVDETLSEVFSTTVDGKILSASLCEGGFIVAVYNQSGAFCIWLDFFCSEIGKSEAYKNQAVQKIISYEDGQAVIYYAENQAENNLIFRFYKNRSLTVERYVSSMYNLKLLDLYRISDQYTLFFHYSSAFHSGGGYAIISEHTISADCKYVELSYNYSLLDVCPGGESYALLTAGEKGTKILLLDKNLNRSEAIELSQSPADNGTLSFDGTSYYCFIGGTNGGNAFGFDSEFENRREINVYDGVNEIACEINSLGKIVHLCFSKKDENVIILTADGLFSKRLHGTNCSPKFLITHKLGLIVVGDGSISGTTLSCYGGTDVYLAVLN